MRRSGPGLRESILQQLSQLVAITGQHIAPYLPSIIDILKDYWADHLEYILSIVQQIALTSANTFSTFLPLLLPLLLSSLTIPRGLTASAIREVRNVLKPLEQTLMCHVALRQSLRSHIHLFVPALCKLISHLQEVSEADTLMIQAQAIYTLRCLCAVSTGTVVEQCHVIVSIVVHTLSRTIIRTQPLKLPEHHDIFAETIATLSVLAQQVGHRILPFDSLIMRCFDNRGLDTSPYVDVAVPIRMGIWDESLLLERDDYFESMISSTSTMMFSSGTGSGGSSGKYSPGGRHSSFARMSETKLMGVTGGGGGGNDMGGMYPWTPDPQALATLNSSNGSNSTGSVGTAGLMPSVTFAEGGGGGNGDATGSGSMGDAPKLFLNQQQLARAWDVSQRSTATDWHEWLWRFNVDLLRESPLPTMRACAALAQAHAPMVSSSEW